MLEVDVWQVEGVLVQGLVASAAGHVLHLPHLRGAPGRPIGDVLRVTPAHHVSLRHVLTGLELRETLLKGRHYSPLYVDHPERVLTGVADLTNPSIIKFKVDCVLL